MRFNTVLIGLAIIAISFGVTLKAFDWMSPRAISPPTLQALPPLPPIRQSSVVVPVSVPLTAIRDLVDRTAPRSFGGKADNPAPQLVQNADISWSVARGAVAVKGAAEQVTVTAPLTGTLSAKGSLSTSAQNKVGDTLGKLFGDKIAKQVGVNIKSLSASGDIKGMIAITARPKVLPDWHVDPNLSAQVLLSDSNVAVAGARINVPAQVKPVIDKAVNEQVAQLQQTIRNDGALERSARREWARICRSIPLQGAGVPNGFWLELRPTNCGSMTRLNSWKGMSIGCWCRCWWMRRARRDGSASAAKRPSTSGAVRCSIRKIRRCGSPTFSSRWNRKLHSACSAKRPAPRCRICRRRSPSARCSTSSRNHPMCSAGSAP
jgi:hypothetical protein